MTVGTASAIPTPISTVVPGIPAQGGEARQNQKKWSDMYPWTRDPSFCEGGSAEPDWCLIQDKHQGSMTLEPSSCLQDIRGGHQVATRVIGLTVFLGGCPGVALDRQMNYAEAVAINA